MLGKHKRQSKKHPSGASSSDEEPDYGKRSRYNDLSRASTEEGHHKLSSHSDQSTDRHKKSESRRAEAERRSHKERKEVINGDTTMEERPHEMSRKHSSSVKRQDSHHHDNDRSRSRSADVERRHRKDRPDSCDDTGSHKVEKQRGRRTEEEHSEHSSRKHTRHSDEDRHGSGKSHR